MLKEIKERENEFLDLWKRMDDDNQRLINPKYTLKDYKSKGEKEIADAYSVCFPLAQIHYNKFISKLIILKLKYRIGLEGKEMTKVLNFLRDSDFAVDELLSDRMENPALFQHIGYICNRGWVAEQNLWRIENGKLITDTRPLDPRWVSWDSDGSELKWASYNMKRTASTIKYEYGRTVPNELADVRDVWTKDANYIYINNEKVFEQSNPYGYVPFVIAPAPWGAMYEGYGSLKNTGESVFYPQRSIYDEYNFIASITKTIAREGFRPALQTASPKNFEKYPGSGDIVTNVEPIQNIPRPDTTNAQQTYMGMADMMNQLATFSRVDHGSTSAPMSGAAIEDLVKGGAEILASRVKGLRVFLRKSARMKVEQFKQLGQTLSIGYSRKYSPKDLEGEYDLDVYLTDNSIAGYMARGQAAGSLLGTMPLDWLRQNIIQVDDPERVDDKYELEEAERMYPIVNLIDQTVAYIRENTPEANEKAWALATQSVAMVRQMQEGQQPEPTAKERPMPNTMRQGSVVAGE